MRSKTGFTGPGMQTAGMMTAVADTGAKAGVPGMMTDIGAADKITIRAEAVTQSVTLGPGTTKSSIETGASCMVGMLKEREAETTTALGRATAADQNHPAMPRGARLTLGRPYLGMQR